MIAPHLRVDGFTPEEFRRLRRAFGPPPGIAVPPLVLVLDQGRVVKALRPLSGATPGEDVARYPWRGPASLPELRRIAGARLAFAIELETITRLVHAIDAGVELRQDWIEQLLVVARALRGELGRGLVADPDVLARLPLPSYAALQQTLDALLPDNHCAALFVFDGGHRGALHGSAIIEKRGGHIVRLTSHRALDITPTRFDGGRHELVLDVMARRIAPAHLALFCTRDAWRAIAGATAGALARQIALREAVLDPIPPWLLALTSIGAAASVAKGASRLLGRFVPSGLRDTARDAARALTATPFGALGFDPIQLYAELRKLL